MWRYVTLTTSLTLEQEMVLRTLIMLPGTQLLFLFHNVIVSDEPTQRNITGIYEYNVVAFITIHLSQLHVPCPHLSQAFVTLCDKGLGVGHHIPVIWFVEERNGR